MIMSERIRELMTENNLNGKQLAEAVNVSVSAVSLWLRNTNDISIENLFALSKLFKCSIDYLVCRTEIDAGCQKREVAFLARLDELLFVKKVSLYSLNKKGILPKSNYYTWLKGAAPRLSNLLVLSTYFDCTMDYLLGC